MGRPTHDRLVTLRQTSWFSPRGECEEAGRPGPPLLFLYSRSFKFRSTMGLDVSTLQNPPATAGKPSKNLSTGHPPCLFNFFRHYSWAHGPTAYRVKEV